MREIKEGLKDAVGLLFLLQLMQVKSEKTGEMEPVESKAKGWEMPSVS